MTGNLQIPENHPEFRALSWLNHLPLQPLEDGDRLVDLTSFEGVPLWWLVHPYVSRDFLLLARKVASSASQSRASDVGLASWPLKAATDPLLDFKLGLVRAEPSFWQRGVYATKAGLWRRILRVYYDRYVPVKWKVRSRVATPDGLAAPKNRRRVLAVSHSRLWGQLGWGKRGDLVLEPVIGYLKEHGLDVVGAEADYGERGDTATLRQRQHAGQWFAFEAFTGPTVQEVYRKAQVHFVSLFGRLRQSRAFRNLFTFEDTDLYAILEARLELIFANLLPHVARMFETARRMLAAVEPDVVLLAYETGPVGRAVSAAARMRSIPTVAVQHGRIHPFHHHYAQCMGTSEKCPSARERLLPDVTCVYGQQVVEILTHFGGYRSTEVVVTGQPRTDLILEGAGRFDREAFLARIGADSTLPVVLLATQNFPNVQDRMRVLEVVFGEPATGWQVLIKTHPGERDGLVERFLHEHGVQRALVLREAELYGCLAAADVVATGTSTVGMEALLFGKPVVTVGGLPSPLDLASAGAAIEVQDAREFRHVVSELLNDVSFRRSLLSRAEAYVKRYFDGVDGQASRRVADQIEARMRLKK